MNRKDYQVIANALRVVREKNKELVSGNGGYKLALYDVALELASKLAEDNPKFDRKKFIDAC